MYFLQERTSLCTFFNLLQEHMPFTPTRAFADFKVALHNAIRLVIQGITIEGCLRIQNDSKPVCVLLSTALVCVACKGLGAMWRLLDLLKHETRTSYMQSSAVGQLHVGDTDWFGIILDPKDPVQQTTSRQCMVK
jgi:hypothetical protein